MKIKSQVTLAAFAVAILSSFIPFGLSAQNPIVQTNYTADPAPMVHNGTVYLYTTHDEDKTVRNFFTMRANSSPSGSFNPAIRPLRGNACPGGSLSGGKVLPRIPSPRRAAQSFGRWPAGLSPFVIFRIPQGRAE